MIDIIIASYNMHRYCSNYSVLACLLTAIIIILSTTSTVRKNSYQPHCLSPFLFFSPFFSSFLPLILFFIIITGGIAITSEIVRIALNNY